MTSLQWSWALPPKCPLFRGFTVYHSQLLYPLLQTTDTCTPSSIPFFRMYSLIKENWSHRWFTYTQVELQYNIMMLELLVFRHYRFSWFNHKSFQFLYKILKLQINISWCHRSENIFAHCFLIFRKLSTMQVRMTGFSTYFPRDFRRWFVSTWCFPLQWDKLLKPCHNWVFLRTDPWFKKIDYQRNELSRYMNDTTSVLLEEKHCCQMKHHSWIFFFLQAYQQWLLMRV